MTSRTSTTRYIFSGLKNIWNCTLEHVPNHNAWSKYVSAALCSLADIQLILRTRERSSRDLFGSHWSFSSYLCCVYSLCAASLLLFCVIEEATPSTGVCKILYRRFFWQRNLFSIWIDTHWLRKRIFDYVLDINKTILVTYNNKIVFKINRL